MEPKRMLVISTLESSNGTIREGDYVWMFGESENGQVLIEIGDRRFEVPAEALVETPVPIPTEELEQLDTCFLAGPGAFLPIHVNDEYFFRVLECEHGNLFLEDTVTGIAWYTRLIFMGNIQRDAALFLDFWERHRALSNDQIHLKGIGI